MEYVDRPKPSPSFVALVVSMIVLFGLLALAFPLIEGVVPVALFTVTIFPLVLLAIESLHAAYATEYRISDGTLELRCGWLMHRRIPLEDIQSVENVKLISRVLGWSPGVLGYCNRFGNGLLLRTSERMVFVSPTDVDAFRAALKCSGASHTVQPLVAEPEWIKRGAAIFFALGGVLFIVLAVPLIAGIVPPNGLYGLRTNMTMSSPEIWYPANRANGLYLLAAGVAIIAGNLALLRHARRLSSTTITLAGAGWTLICTIASFLLTLWHIG